MAVDRELPERRGERPERRNSRERSLTRLLAGLRAMDAGDFSVRLDPNGDPLMAELILAFNTVAQRHNRLTDEMVRIASSVGREGKMRDRASIGPASGQWSVAVDSINSLITDLVQPTSEVARVIKAVAEGDLSQKVELEIDGKPLRFGVRCKAVPAKHTERHFASSHPIDSLLMLATRHGGQFAEEPQNELRT